MVDAQEEPCSIQQEEPIAPDAIYLNVGPSFSSAAASGPSRCGEEGKGKAEEVIETGEALRRREVPGLG
jgi:hypothetical protein